MGHFVAPFRDSLTHTCWDVLMDLKQCLKLEIVEKTALSHTFEMWTHKRRLIWPEYDTTNYSIDSNNFLYNFIAVIFAFFVVYTTLLTSTCGSGHYERRCKGLGPGALWGKRSFCDEEQGKSPIASFLTFTPPAWAEVWILNLQSLKFNNRFGIEKKRQKGMHCSLTFTGHQCRCKSGTCALIVKRWECGGNPVFSTRILGRPWMRFQ